MVMSGLLEWAVAYEQGTASENGVKGIEKDRGRMV